MLMVPTHFRSDARADASTQITLSVLHTQLMEYGARRLAPAGPAGACELAKRRELDFTMAALEERFVEAERANVGRLAAEAPSDPDGFVAWFEALRSTGPGQDDPLFEWLAGDAGYEQMRWFIRQEVVGEAGFDDLLALTQLRMPVEAKLEIARNYWDEMGRGRCAAMHGPLLARTSALLEAHDPQLGPVVWEARALANLLVALAANRHYAFHSVGALGAVELTAPTRTGKVAAGLTRLGLPKEATHYFALHASIDLVHAEAWLRNVLATLVAEEPARARWMAEGALMRLNAGARCFDRYRQHFGLGGARAQRLCGQPA